MLKHVSKHVTELALAIADGSDPAAAFASIGAKPVAVDPRVLACMEASAAFAVTTLKWRDPLSGILMMPYECHSDGKWFWSNLATYLYRQYGLPLEGEFVLDAERACFRLRDVPCDLLCELRWVPDFAPLLGEVQE
jgi:hypothetical protein